MGNSKTKPEEEIIINQNQQQQQQPQQFGSAVTFSGGIGPLHVIAACLVILLLALAARFLWKVLTREIDIRSPKRVDSVATIV